MSRDSRILGTALDLGRTVIGGEGGITQAGGVVLLSDAGYYHEAMADGVDIAIDLIPNPATPFDLAPTDPNSIGSSVANNFAPPDNPH